jgi:glycosyltransferase involved in cell wall biosynthesis
VTILRHNHNAEFHICHLVLGLPMGGTEGLVDKMLRNPPEGFRSSVICLDEIGVLGEAATCDGLNVSLVPRGNGFNWRVARCIAKHAKACEVDVLQCHHYTPWCYGALARLWYPRMRVIFTEHGRHYPDIPSFKRRLFNKGILPLTHAITAVSPYVANALERVEKIPLNRIRIVFNGVDDSGFKELLPRRDLRRKLELRDEYLYYILCSRLDPIKWIEGMLAAYRRVLDAFPQSGLILVGEGESRKQIESEINRLGLTAHVKITGYRKNVFEWLAASDIFVLSSHSEGTSVSLIESMAAGLPAVVTDAGGNPFVVQNEVTGKVVPVRDVNALAMAMLSLAKDPEMYSRYSANARKRFEEEFQLTRMFDSYHEIYSVLLSGRD